MAAGDLVHVTGSIEDLCYDTQPSERVTVFAQRSQDREPFVIAVTETDSHGRFSVDVAVNETVRLGVACCRDARSLQYAGPVNDPRDPEPVVYVDRVSGSCESVLQLSAPAAVRVGDAVRIEGTAPDTATVNVLFRKRGTTTFQVRRAITPHPDHTFSTFFYADDDYRLYASGQRCDSQPLLVQVQPVISGPASVRRGSSVTLLVRAPAGVPVRVYFHRAGTSGYAARRIGTVDSNGRYVTTYVADVDYRYYALTGPGARTSNIGLTQTRG